MNVTDSYGIMDERKCQNPGLHEVKLASLLGSSRLIQLNEMNRYYDYLLSVIFWCRAIHFYKQMMSQLVEG